MGNKIAVDMEKLDAAATKIEEYAGNYKSDYTQLFTEIDAMANNWKGTDNVAYTTQIKGFQDDFDKMYTLLTNLSQFIKDSSTAYKTTQTDIESGAKTLTN